MEVMEAPMQLMLAAAHPALGQQQEGHEHEHGYDHDPDHQQQQQQEGHTLFLPTEVLLNHVVAFLRPRDVAALASAGPTLRRLNPHAHVRCIKGKFRSSSLLLANLHRCRRLAALDLRGNRLTSDGIRTLGDFLARAAPSASSLESLDLSALSLTPLGIRLLAQSLSGRRAAGAGAEAAAAAAEANSTSITTTQADTQLQQPQQPNQQQQAPPRPQPQRRLPLRTLALAVNNAGDEGAAAIGDLFASGALPRLEEANVSNSVITFQGLAHLARGLAGCPRLRRLNLSNNPLFEIPGALFPFGVAAASEAALAAWDAFARALPPTLESLSIFNALLSTIAIHRLVLHWRAPGLRGLNLSWNRIGADGAAALAQSLAKGACPSLQSLNLSHCVVNRSALPALTQALSAPGGIRHSIQHLNLGWNPLNATDADQAPPHQPYQQQQQQQQDPLRALAFALARCPNLDTLTLSNVELGDEGATALVQGFLDAAADAEAASLTSTTSSSSLYPAAAEEGAVAVVVAGGCLPKLTQLNVSWNGVGPRGAKAIAGLFATAASSSSSSSHNPSPVARAPSLQSLDISYNAAGAEGLRAMADAWGASGSNGDNNSNPLLPPGLVLHVIGNRVPRCVHHQVPAAQLGQLLDDIDSAGSTAAAAAAAAVAAMAAVAARHQQEQQQQTTAEQGAQTDMVVVASSPAEEGGGEEGVEMDQGTQTPPPPFHELEQPQAQQHQQHVPPLPPALPVMAPLPTTPEHPHQHRPRGVGASPHYSSPHGSTHTGAVAAAAAAGSLRRSARVRRTATATITAPYIPPSSSEGYYLTTRNRRRRLCTHGNSGRR